MKSLLLGLLIMMLFSVSVFGATYTLQWDPNSEPDLAGYKVYVGTESGNYSEVIIPTGDQALATTYTGTVEIPVDAKITYYFAVTAYDESGLESDYSNEVFKEYDTRVPPSPPKNLKWYEKILNWFNKHFKLWS